MDWRWMRGMAFQNDTMAKVKLYLQANDHNQLKMFATAHKAAMNLNVNFSTPLPAAVVFGPALTAYGTKLDAIETAEIALKVLRADRDTLRETLETHLVARGASVDSTAGGGRG